MKRTFYCTMAYELPPGTPPEARKLLRAELVGRRWNDRTRSGMLMPASAVWVLRAAGDEETTDDLHRHCAHDLRDAAAAVSARSGKPLRVVRAWIHVSGGGTLALAPAGALAAPDQNDEAPKEG